ncbi:NADH:flavin oxidoreductase/NADH oxidase [Gymnopus androsaceus JB14]|uniref:NADH:flavin oxidoreductase/NADH oxidase n=1 Tax=Gymnopus androsaceus JB14 TaxID=1447944 RepID=A0A6A4IN81_9AGAR|nr:NADH:flavin oxidoreductase/NADH oxidase [Gymnopus androsaceus JB14]
MKDAVPKPNLFQPLKVGNMHLSHRIVLAPLTRMRVTPSQAPIPGLVKEYYTQRASTPGTLLISEAAFISPKAGGMAAIPGIWSDEQIQGWKEVADAVHAKGSYIFFQIVAIGRGANLSDLQAHDPSFDVVGAGDIPDPAGGFFPGTIPRPLTKAEIDEYVETFSVAASNAVHKAGFDGVELHGANGHLIEQFLRDTSNNRTDEYGGSIENRARFLLEITERVSKAVGEEKTAVRISPWLNERDLAMDDPIPTFSYAVTELKSRFPKLAYLHAIEPRVSIAGDVREVKENESNDFLKAIWSPRPLILAGGFVRDNAIEAAGTEGVLIAYGRHYIANPDLPYRLKYNIPLNKYDRSTFYIPGDASGRGYTDYSFATVEVNA